MQRRLSTGDKDTSKVDWPLRPVVTALCSHSSETRAWLVTRTIDPRHVEGGGGAGYLPRISVPIVFPLKTKDHHFIMAIVLYGIN